MILIKLNGELQLVHSLDGCDGCEIIEADIEPPPNEHCHCVDGKWVEDSEAKAAAEYRAKLHGMSRAELVEHIVGRALSAPLPKPNR